MTGIGSLALRCFAWSVLLFLVAPVLLIVPMSFSSSAYFEFPPPGWSLRWYEEFLADRQWLLAIKNSLIVGALSAVCATTIGTVAALGLLRVPPRASRLLLAFLMAPMIIPLIITALGVYFAFSALGWIETLLAMVLAHTMLAIPFVVVVVLATLQGYDLQLDRAAASLGASPLRGFFKVTLPNVWPGILSGAAFAFVTSFDEVVVALFISGTEWRTLPVKMFGDIRYETRPTITAVAVLVIFFSTAALAISEGVRQRSARLRQARRDDNQRISSRLKKANSTEARGYDHNHP